MGSGAWAVVRDLPTDARDALVARGHRGRDFFPHRVVRLRKGGIDGMKLAQRMVGPVAATDLRQLLLHALPPVLDEFPTEMFFDDDVVWHQQQFGLPGHVATASIVVRDGDVYMPTMVGDLVQRIGRRREQKTRVENRFKGWARLLVHAALDFARDEGARRLFVADSDHVLAHTDPARTVQPDLYRRIYDHSVGPPFAAVHDPPWWVLDVDANAPAVVHPTPGRIPITAPDVYVCHDIERGWGHLDDTEFAAAATVEGPARVRAMLAEEAEAGARATYSVVGMLWDDVVPLARAAGHAVAFHSFDHAEPGDDGWLDQLRQCRQIDYRVKGYRPAQSRLTPELTHENLGFANFEWLASSAYSFGFDEPRLDGGIVHIPIAFDDFALHEGSAYRDWESSGWQRLTQTLERGAPAVFSLHDCYAPHWLPHYRELLTRVTSLGTTGTLDDLAAATLLADAR